MSEAPPRFLRKGETSEALRDSSARGETSEAPPRFLRKGGDERGPSAIPPPPLRRGVGG